MIYMNKLITNKLHSQTKHDLELEMDTLACIVWNPNNYSKIMLLEVDDFYGLNNKELFTALRESYEKDKVINPSTIPGKLKKDNTFLELVNKREAIITTQVNINIKKLKEIKASRDVQIASYEATVKIEQGEDPIKTRDWLSRKMEKIDNSYGKKEITTTELEDKFDAMIDKTNFDSITSGFPLLDKKIGGFEEGTMTIIASAQVRVK